MAARKLLVCHTSRTQASKASGKPRAGRVKAKQANKEEGMEKHKQSGTIDRSKKSKINAKQANKQGQTKQSIKRSSKQKRSKQQNAWR